MGRKKRRGLTRHHIKPRSRGGADDDSNLVILDRDFHFAWHECFRNMTNEEIMTFIHIVMLSDHRWDHETLIMLREGLIEDDHVKIYNAIKEAEDG